MPLATLLFYMFSGILLGSAVGVVTARNMVHSVLFLILAFLNAAGIFLLAQAEFLALILVIVYVGAVAVLFLFVVMMLNEAQNQPYRLTRFSGILGLFVGAIFLGELLWVGAGWKTSPEALGLQVAPGNSLTNTEALGNLLYTHYILIFQAAGLLLLIAMVGAIVLTLRHREGVLKQTIRDQVARTARDSIRLVDIPNGSKS